MPIRYEDLRAKDDQVLDQDFFNKRYRAIAEEIVRLSEATEGYGDAEAELIRVGLQRINEIIAPAIAAIQGAIDLGFLTATSSTSVQIPAAGNAVQLNIDDNNGARAIFKPTPYLTLMRQADGAENDWAIARLTAYDPDTGDIILEIKYRNGLTAAYDDYAIASSGGVVAAMAQILSDTTAIQADINATYANVLDAIEAITNGGAVVSVNGKAGIVELVIADIPTLQTTLNGKANTTHSHAMSEITNLVSTLASKASLAHTHAIADTPGLQTALNGKSDLGHIHSIAEVNGLTTALQGKVDVGVGIQTGTGLGSQGTLGDPNDPFIIWTENDVNGDVGTFQNATITVDAKGRVTAAANGSAGPAVFVRAAGSFNGATMAENWKSGIASITRISPGGYRVTFSTPMPDDKYIIDGQYRDTDGVYNNNCIYLATKLTTRVDFYIRTPEGVVADQPLINFTITR